MNSKILVVEDNEISYILINEIFIKDTVDVLWAKDAKEAFKIYKTNKNVSLIIMDIQLPTISGYEATEKFKKYNPSIPIIAITAFDKKYSYENSINAGCDDFITKPINTHSFKKRINKHLYQSV